MDLMPFDDGTGEGLALRRGNLAIDLAELLRSAPRTLDEVIAGGASLLSRIEDAATATQAGWRPVSAFKPRYPISVPHKVICVGLNYAAHAAEGGHAIPDYPAFFLRVRDSMLAAEESILKPKQSDRLDFEAELMVVIGREARNISEQQALDHVFGYTIFNDASLRDYQRKGGQWTPGKNFDRTGAVGPVVVTADALPPGASGLDIACRLNGRMMQSSNTSDMIFPVARIIALCSEFTTLRPGDLIATGTPSGVGFARTPPIFMQAGDEVEIEIERIGVLRNTVVAHETVGV